MVTKMRMANPGFVHELGLQSKSRGEATKWHRQQQVGKLHTHCTTGIHEMAHITVGACGLGNIRGGGRKLEPMRRRHPRNGHAVSGGHEVGSKVVTSEKNL
ncbi:uncharacterized protein DS421_3g75920 [Arachis hypogaea]|nr:uncharacterized protein DS421_3g75920 [Arachis hypogaea]